MSHSAASRPGGDGHDHDRRNSTDASARATARRRLRPIRFKKPLAPSARRSRACRRTVVRRGRWTAAPSARFGSGTSPAGAGRPALLLGPLAVDHRYRKRGVGAALMQRALATPASAVTTPCCWLGTPAYYGRFGFSAEKTGSCGCLAPMSGTGSWRCELRRGRARRRPRADPGADRPGGQAGLQAGRAGRGYDWPQASAAASLSRYKYRGRRGRYPAAPIPFADSGG